MLRLYDFLESGNGYKVRLLLTQLGIPFERVQVDILSGETRNPAFLALNPNGRIPALRLTTGEVLAESNAILYYLADGTPFLPATRTERAHVMQWMCFEQYSHEPNIATSRFWLHFVELTDEKKALLQEKNRLGYAALDVMEQHLTERRFFVGERYTIADIALYAYTHVAAEGNFDLSHHPHINAWMARVREQPKHIPITSEI